MRRFPLVCMVALVACSCTTTDRQYPQVPAKTPPQARPVATFLLALFEKDMGLYRSAFSSRQRVRLEAKGVRNVFRAQRSHVTRGLAELGDFDVADFAYSFSGDDESGLVHIALGDRQFGEMRVINEGGTWKLDEIDERK